jgi:hypothetical protein
MTGIAQKLWNDDCGFVVSAELVLVLTIGVLMMVVGLHAVAKGVTQELNDVSSAIGALNQTYKFDGLKKPGHAFVSGSAYMDTSDDCDCTTIVQIRPEPKFDNGNGPESGLGGGSGSYGYR